MSVHCREIYLNTYGTCITHLWHNSDKPPASQFNVVMLGTAMPAPADMVLKPDNKR